MIFWRRKKEEPKLPRWMRCVHAFKTIAVSNPAGHDRLQFDSNSIMECLICGVQCIVHPTWGKNFTIKVGNSRPNYYGPMNDRYKED